MVYVELYSHGPAMTYAMAGHVQLGLLALPRQHLSDFTYCLLRCIIYLRDPNGIVTQQRRHMSHTKPFAFCQATSNLVAPQIQVCTQARRAKRGSSEKSFTLESVGALLPSVSWQLPLLKSSQIIRVGWKGWGCVGVPTWQACCKHKIHNQRNPYNAMIVLHD